MKPTNLRKLIKILQSSPRMDDEFDNVDMTAYKGKHHKNCGCLAYHTAIAEDKFQSWFFLDVTEEVSHILGFESRIKLKKWIQENAEIWGNNHGYKLFTDATAFNGATHLKQIVEHLEGVHGRLVAK